MNKKLSSLFISFILLISGLMIFNIESVSAVQGWAVNITSKTSTTPYFNNNSIPVLFDVKVTIIDVPQNANVSRIKITAPQNYVLDLKIKNKFTPKLINRYLQKSDKRVYLKDKSFSTMLNEMKKVYFQEQVDIFEGKR